MSSSFSLSFVIFEILLLSVCVVGEYLIVYPSSRLVRVVCDNSLHGLIATTSWLVVIEWNMRKNTYIHIHELFEAFICGCCVDADHFIAARSWRLQVGNIRHRFTNEECLIIDRIDNVSLTTSYIIKIIYI